MYNILNDYNYKHEKSQQYMFFNKSFHFSVFQVLQKPVKIQSNANIVLCIIFCIQEFNRVSYTDTLSDFIYKE